MNVEMIQALGEYIVMPLCAVVGLVAFFWAATK